MKSRLSWGIGAVGLLFAVLTIGGAGKVAPPATQPAQVTIDLDKSIALDLPAAGADLMPRGLN